MDFDFNHLSDSSKAMLNGVPFLAGIVRDVPTPYYTKLLQSVITFAVIGLVGWSASIVIQNKETSITLNSQLTLLNQQLVFMKNGILENKAEIKVLKEVGTKDRVYRPEWRQKNSEQDKRLLYLERAIK